MTTRKDGRDKIQDLEEISAFDETEVRAALGSLGHLKPCSICDGAKWVVESLKGKAVPVRFDGYASPGWTVAFQATCIACGHLRFVDAQTIFKKIKTSKDL